MSNDLWNSLSEGPAKMSGSICSRSGVFFVWVALTASASVWGDEPPKSPEDRLRADVGYLADDAREGRSPGSKGIEAAADYIANRFRELGLKTATGAEAYFQPFDIVSGARIGNDLALVIHGPNDRRIGAIPNTNFRPLALGSGGKLDGASLVFVGFGITALDPAEHLDYDDYADIDVKGKAVLMLRRQPSQPPNEKGEPSKPFAGKKDSNYATFRHKATNALQHGAAAILFVNDTSSLDADADTLLPFLGGGSDLFSNIPFVMITRELADQLLAASSQPKLTELEKAINSDLKPKSRALEGLRVDATIPVERSKVATKNVVGVLEGSGPSANETIVLGAHYDHLGHGGLTSGSLAFFSKEIHNGADDNASGTSMMLEIARRLAARPDPLPRRVVFIAFSGEERGLLGSSHYVNHPLYPLGDTVMMVNFDMVGRLNDKSELTVYGTGTTPGIDTIVDAIGKASGFTIKKIADGSGPSDQESFYRQGMPVLFLFTGTHRDYHRPSDDSALINFKGMSRIADYAELLALELVRRPTRPEFVRVKTSHGGGQDIARSAVRVYLGTMPSYDEGGKGVKLDGVREESPAEKAGLKPGDVIVGFGGKPITTVYDYTESLSRYKPGDIVEITVQRDGKEIKLSATLGSRP